MNRLLNIRNSIGQKISDKQWEMSFLILYTIIYLRDCISTTTINYELPRLVTWGILVILGIYTVSKIIFSDLYERRERYFAYFLLLTFIVVGIVSDYHELLYIALLIVGVKGVDFRKIVCIYSVITVLVLGAAFLLSQFGIIENLVYESSRHPGAVRNSFGCIYPTDFGAHIFFGIVAILCVKDISVKIWKVLLPLLGAFLLYTQCEGMTGTICLIGLSLVLLIYLLIQRWDIAKAVAMKVSSVFFFVPAIGFCGMAIAYKPGLPVWDKLNQILSLRLAYSDRAIKEYGFSLLGTHFVEFGLGGRTEGFVDVFFVDDSYLRILVKYGILVFLFTLVILFLLHQKLLKKKCDLLLMIWVLISMQSFMEHHLIETAYNPFILLLFANVDSYLRKREG